MKKLILIASTFILMQICNAQTDSLYFGETPPGETATIFEPDILSGTYATPANIIFSKDGKECYFSAGMKIYFSKYLNNNWTVPQEASFSTGNRASAPFLSADGNRLYFTISSADYTSSHIYKVSRDIDEWGDPQPMPSPINSTFVDDWYTETDEGVAYFSSNRTGGYGDNDIWYINPATGQAENLGANVNSASAEYSPQISPDGSYLIFSSYRTGGIGYSDIYVTFKKENNEWTKALNIEINGAGINIAEHDQVVPSISPDGKYLFFIRHDDDFNINSYWCKIDNIISALKETTLTNLVDYIESENLISVFPNPASQSIQLKGDGISFANASYQLTNINGRVVKQGILESDSIDISGLGKGIYLLSLHTCIGLITEKVVIE